MPDKAPDLMIVLVCSALGLFGGVVIGLFILLFGILTGSSWALPLATGLLTTGSILGALWGFFITARR